MPVILDIGSLRHKLDVQVQNLTVRAGGTGNQDATFVTILSMRAKVEPLTGFELFTAARVHGNVSHKVTIPYLRKLNQTMRFIWTVAGIPDRILNIKSVVNMNEENVSMEVMCLEATS
jgi:SPP1 family predicted phage head-tail adaptor